MKKLDEIIYLLQITVLQVSPYSLGAIDQSGI